MNLKEYLFFKEMSVKEFAQIAGFHVTYISSIITRKRCPSKKALKLIEFATEGWVKQNTVFAETQLPTGFKRDEIIPLPRNDPDEEDESEEDDGEEIQKMG